MAFMQEQVTEKISWLKIDGTSGITFLPLEDLVHNRKAFLLLSPEMQLETAQPYYEGRPESVEIIKGYGARLSAPGYMDCTDWDVYDSPEEAVANLREMYGDDDEDE